jgi:hypothetical protein
MSVVVVTDTTASLSPKLAQRWGTARALTVTVAADEDQSPCASRRFLIMMKVKGALRIEPTPGEVDDVHP